MKIRTDFVTNSSSSSFIVGFKDESEIEKVLDQVEMNAKLRKRLINDIKRGHIPASKAIVDFNDERAYDIQYHTEFAFNKKIHAAGYRNLRDWLKADYENQKEFYDAVKKEFDEESKAFIDAISKCEYVAEITYGSGGEGCDYELECEIVPFLPCTIITYNHH